MSITRIALRLQSVKLPENLIVRTLASATATDPIQKLFLDKIREYKSKAASAPGGLVDADEKTRKALADDEERIRRTYGVNKGSEGTIETKFTDEIKIDPINQKDW